MRDGRKLMIDHQKGEDINLTIYGPMHGSQNIPFKKIVLNKKCDQYYCTIFYRTIFSFNFI